MTIGFARCIKFTFCMATLFTCLEGTQKDSFWKSQKRGANIFNYTINEETIIAAKDFGISFVRLAPDKFASNARDFLMGNADSYQGLIKEDMDRLRSLLDLFHKHQLPVLLVFLSLPGSRWSQNNDSIDDLRIWKDDALLEQAAQFWQDVAKELKDHPAIVGYNILNEPHPERITNTTASNIAETSTPEDQEALNKFNVKIVSAIRNVDKQTPIIIESSGYAYPEALAKMIPVAGDQTLYSFHMYEPENYTFSRQNKAFCYPGSIPNSDTEESKHWDKQEIENYLTPVLNWQTKHNIPSSRILVGEFGAFRNLPGVDCYFQDLISIFDKHGWHWAVYSFREDNWDKMNYELDCSIDQKKYWLAIENNTLSDLYNPENKTFEMLSNGWKNA